MNECEQITQYPKMITKNTPILNKAEMFDHYNSSPAALRREKLYLDSCERREKKFKRERNIINISCVTAFFTIIIGIFVILPLILYSSQ